MAEYSYPPRQPVPSRARNRQATVTPWLLRLPMLLLTGAILFSMIMVLATTAHQINYDGLIYPGVSAYGVSLGGLSRDQAADALAKQYTYGSKAIFTFRDAANPSKTWSLTAADLGVQFDPKQTVEAAYQIGRGNGFVRNLLDQWGAHTRGSAVQPTIIYDQSKAGGFLASIALEIDKPVQEATIMLTGTKVTTTTAQVGRALDIDATLNALRGVILTMNTGAEIPLVVKETQPAVKDAEEAATKIRAALSNNIQLYIDAAKPDAGPWMITPEFISGILRITRVEDADGSGRYEVTADVSPLKTVLANLATTLYIEPVSARFTFNANTQQLESLKESVDGRSLNVEATLQKIDAALFKADVRRIPLTFKQEIPSVSSQSTAAELGIVKEVVKATTYFFGSSPERRTNIQVAASKFHGLVIAPGEVFSFNKYLGDVSPETGYETGLVIVGNQTIKGVGGGVCQVSSTVFQAAFFAAFPINERLPHGYRVGYYESGVAFVDGIQYKSGVGMDATVFAPIVDFKFTNDTAHYLLMETYYDGNAQSLTVKLFSTSSGRIVSKDGPTLSKPVPHGPAIYEETPELRPGQSRQVDYAVDGIDARVWRTIKKDGQVIVNKEEFYSHYLPWSARFQVARGAAPKRNN
jgi:vancomycin resistance protein YoaR